MKTFAFYADPGHGWAKVPMNELRKLGIEQRITSFSYLRGTHAYLEEDCDLETFVRAYRAHYGQAPQFNARHTNRSSRIRADNSYRFIA